MRKFLDEISMDQKEIIYEALSIFYESSLDFVDCILIARHSVLGEEIMSFDNKLNKMLWEG